MSSFQLGEEATRKREGLTSLSAMCGAFLAPRAHTYGKRPGCHVVSCHVALSRYFRNLSSPYELDAITRS